MPNFTPGPWAVDEDDHYLIYSPEFHLVATVSEPEDFNEASEAQCVADARLIAASPDFWWAAYIDRLSDGDDYRQMSEECRKHYPELYLESGKHVGLVPERVQWVARRLRDAALTKAEGGSNAS